LGYKLFSRYFSAKSKPTSTNEVLVKYLVSKLKIKPQNAALYEQAFRHRTLSATPDQSNERLEFVGDAILDAVVAGWAFKNYPNEDEGFLSKLKSRVVSRSNLNELAAKMKITDFVQVKMRSGQAMTAIGGNALEALIGALYEDQGFEKTKLWVEKHIISSFDFSLSADELNDAKSELYEQAHRKEANLEFKTSTISGNPNPEFETIVLWNEKQIGSATGPAKKTAEQLAAKKALEYLNMP
jgi:ribonuclease III